MIAPHITSTKNDRVKAWRSLRDRGERDRTGLFLVEGERETRRAIEHVRLVETIVAVDRGPLDLPNVVYVSRNVFDHVSARQRPDGVAAVFATPPWSLQDAHIGSATPVLVADGIEKPGNIGAMIRTADGLGAGFIASSLGTDIVNPNVVRSAQGSLFSAPIAVATRKEAIEFCSARGQIVVATPGTTTTLWRAHITPGAAIVVGSEHAGVHADWLAVGDAVSIPMRGAADSFNASVTAALFLGEAVRQSLP